MNVYIIKLVTRDGYFIKHVCDSAEKAVDVSMDAGHKYLFGGGSNRVEADRGSLAKQLVDGKELFLANTRDWTSDLFFVSRYAVE